MNDNQFRFLSGDGHEANCTSFGEVGKLTGNVTVLHTDFHAFSCRKHRGNQTKRGRRGKKKKKKKKKKKIM